MSEERLRSHLVVEHGVPLPVLDALTDEAAFALHRGITERARLRLSGPSARAHRRTVTISAIARSLPARLESGKG